MARIGGLLAVLALALALPPAPARAFHLDGTLVVTGSRTASTTITVPARAELLFDVFNEPGDRDYEGPFVSGGRDLAGVVVTDAAGKIVLYDVAARVGTPRPVLGEPGPERVRLRGDGMVFDFFDTKRYTVTLLADAPVTVRIRVSGMRSRTLRPATPVGVKTYRGGFLPTAAEPRGEARFPVAVRRSSTVLMYTDHATTGYGGWTQWLCVGDRGERCDDNADARAKRRYEYGMWCFSLCPTTVRSTRYTGFHWMLRPRRQGAAEVVARSYMTYGVATDQRAYVLVVG